MGWKGGGGNRRAARLAVMQGCSVCPQGPGVGHDSCNCGCPLGRHAGEAHGITAVTVAITAVTITAVTCGYPAAMKTGQLLRNRDSRLSGGPMDDALLTRAPASHAAPARCANHDAGAAIAAMQQHTCMQCGVCHATMSHVMVLCCASAHATEPSHLAV